MVNDAREQTKIWLDDYITDANITKDNDTTEAAWMSAWIQDDVYPFLEVFDTKAKDVVFGIGEPISRPLIDHDQSIYGYKETVPISIYTIDKDGITGTQLNWKAQAELRLVNETYYLGSLRHPGGMQLHKIEVGGLTIWKSVYELIYTRDTT